MASLPRQCCCDFEETGCNTSGGCVSGKSLRITMAGFSVGTCGCVSVAGTGFAEITALSIIGTYDLPFIGTGYECCMFSLITADGSITELTDSSECATAASNLQQLARNVRLVGRAPSPDGCYVGSVHIRAHLDPPPGFLVAPMLFKYQNSGGPRYYTGQIIPNASCGEIFSDTGNCWDIPSQELANNTGTVTVVGIV